MADYRLSPTDLAALRTSDPIQLHAQAMNALSLVMRELRASRTDYKEVTRQMVRAADALGSLSGIDAQFKH
ncbi:hypothetical protein [Acidovorax sp.]|uniref:hypothetical protein n=1 Tax=Acidovorax sp. TaxID=1872122 RepID=UPI0025BC2071|nr:hypothetical protein [Acidovorax sp.]